MPTVIILPISIFFHKLPMPTAIRVPKFIQKVRVCAMGTDHYEDTFTK